jgi:pectinesterase
MWSNKNAVKIINIGALLCFLLIHASAKDSSIVVTVKNDLKISRMNEVIVLRWNNLKEVISTDDPTKIIVVDERTKERPVSQIIYSDKNNTPADLIFISNFRAKEIKNFVIKVDSGEQKPVQSLTDARFMVPREDVAWENDRIAFRIYGPALAKDVNNGIDVWTKRVHYLIVEKWYKGDEDTGTSRISYHEDHGEGADFFSVGRTLGAGGCSMYKNDSLYQPGVFEKYKIIATGPIRSIFELTYKPVQIGAMNISETKRITLDAGSNLNRIEVTYSSDSAGGSVPFAAGIVKRKGVSSFIDKKNRCVSLWGSTNEKEENGSLGTGIVMTKEFFNGFKEDSTHILVLGAVELGKTAAYYSGAGWTRSGDFNSAEDWNKYLKEFSQRLASPLKKMRVIGKK